MDKKIRIRFRKYSQGDRHLYVCFSTYLYQNVTALIKTSCIGEVGTLNISDAGVIVQGAGHLPCRWLTMASIPSTP